MGVYGGRDRFGHLGNIVSICQSTYLQGIFHSGNEKNPWQHMFQITVNSRSSFFDNLILNISDNVYGALISVID